jgi:hypothetical protein
MNRVKSRRWQNGMDVVLLDLAPHAYKPGHSADPVLVLFLIGAMLFPEDLIGPNPT